LIAGWARPSAGELSDAGHVLVPCCYVVCVAGLLLLLLTIAMGGGLGAEVVG
jgi:hypothetical protein